mmetsp:Transcript_8094/g.12695  ORF Transcript_8094/g.12695 Transcript_8094/m.12695 type:complete len:408 (+) Transcript_8094:57-1280(+)
MMNKPGVITNTARILIDIAQPREGWKTFQFKVAEFGEYEGFFESNDSLDSFPSPCTGDEWSLQIFPGRHSAATAGYLSVYLKCCHPSVGQNSALNVEIKILDKFGTTKKTKRKIVPNAALRSRTSFAMGWLDLMLLSEILDESQNILDQGSLTIAVAIKEPPAAVFVPKNPFQEKMQNKFLDEESSDVCFEVSIMEPNDDNTRRARSLVPFHAHRLILEICAPMLAELFGEESSVVSINDIKPDVFRQMLWYVYGGTVPEEFMELHTKDIIEVADKYSIVNLKLEAEAAYMGSTIITADNVMDNLLYADAKNLAALKEAVMDFLAENGGEVLGNNISFDRFPPELVRDLLVAMTRSRDEGNSGNANDFTMMRVSELRRKLHEKGLGMNIDGSRETMIEALRNCAAGN